MCLSPISIINPTKYVSLHYRDQYLLQVPCGKCAECQSSLSNQWLYRSFVEFNDCLSIKGNFIMFDTLTYAPEYLPKYSDYVECEDDYPAFSRNHVELFFKRLRQKTKRSGYKNTRYRYFLSSEYGKKEGANRPHYHLLLYVYRNGDDLSPIEVSGLISESWIYGRTDGYPWKSSIYVLSHNAISTNDEANILRCAAYVTKYVQKSCEFQKQLDFRINKTLTQYAEKYSPDDPDKWRKSLACHRIKRKLLSITNQFHLQSLHYGENALSFLDIQEIFDKGCLFMPHFKGVKIAISLPTYYKRKLFYRLVEIDGCRSWQLNRLGVDYKRYRKKKLQEDLESRFQCVCIQHHLPFDCKKLADYVLNSRGRIRADFPSESIEQKFGQLDLFNYTTLTDKDNLMQTGLTPTWLGNSSIGYKMGYIQDRISIKQFISQHVILDNELEKQLSKIYYSVSYLDKGKQDAFELKQRLTNMFKCFM